MKLSTVNYLKLNHLKPNYLKPNYVILSLVVILFCSACVNKGVDNEAGLQDRQRILVLNSYHQGYRWSDNIVHAINDQFKDNPNTIIHIEYMDTKMINTEDHFKRLKEIYKYKYAQYAIDVIISSDDNALKFLRRYREALFPGAPVVFCGINNFSKTKVRGFDNYTGVNERVGSASNLELILRLHPKVKKLYVITDSLTSARSLQTEFFEAIKEYEDKFDVEILSDFSLQALIKKVSSLEKDSVVYYLTFSRDNMGRSFALGEVIPSISKASPVPVYGTGDYMLGQGIVGGMLTSGYFQGETAAKAAQKILAGSHAEDIPVILDNPNAFMFDYPQLQRFGIDLSDLPKGSVIVNRPDS